MENPLPVILSKKDMENWKAPVIPESEFLIEYVRSSGPGGQKVNKTSSAALLRWSVLGSTVLTEEQKQVVLEVLKNRINHEGVLVIKMQELRSQKQNADRAKVHVQELVEQALEPQEERKATKPSKNAKNKRMDEKSRRGALKAERRRNPFEE